MDTLPRVKAVESGRGHWILNITWSDGKRDRVDLTGLVHKSRHFGIFLVHPQMFRKVQMAAFGSGIEWENGLDYGADTLKMLAEEQRPVSGSELVRFESELELSTAETATLLGLAQRTIRAYRRAKRLPQSVAIAMRTLKANDTILAAHYRPIGQLSPGRPRKTAA